MRVALIPLAAVVAALALPSTAGASYQDVLRDCSDDGRFDRAHSRPDLLEALHEMPSVFREYTDCVALIRAALSGRRCGSRAARPRGPVIPVRAPHGRPVVAVEGY